MDGMRGEKNSSESCGRWERAKQRRREGREGEGDEEFLLTDFVD